MSVDMLTGHLVWKGEMHQCWGHGNLASGHQTARGKVGTWWDPIHPALGQDAIGSVSYSKRLATSVFTNTLHILCQHLCGDYNDFPSWISDAESLGIPDSHSFLPLHGENRFCVPCLRGLSRGKVKRGEIKVRLTLFNSCKKLFVMVL